MAGWLFPSARPMTPPLRRPHQPSGLAPPCSRKNGGVPHAELHPCWAALSQQHPLLIGSPLGVQPYNTPGRSALITTEAQGDLSNGSWSGKSSKTRAWPSQQGAAGVNCDRQTLKYHQPGTSEGTYDTHGHTGLGGEGDVPLGTQGREWQPSGKLECRPGSHGGRGPGQGETAWLEECRLVISI